MGVFGFDAGLFGFGAVVRNVGVLRQSRHIGPDAFDV